MVHIAFDAGLIHLGDVRLMSEYTRILSAKGGPRKFLSEKFRECMQENMFQVLHVVGARPNFMKVAPVMRALSARPGVSQVLLHTGQHYDRNMSEVFFRQLEIPEPDDNLEVGSGSHAVQTAEIMVRLERVVTSARPDVVLVYGDVNSTVAAALVCSKLGIPVGHVEAGLRSFDRSMPEEINRLVTDQISDLLFTPSEDGNENLVREGVAPEKVFLVGNVMIDTLARMLPLAEAKGDSLRGRLGLAKAYGLVTLHRPSNVDKVETLREIVAALSDISSGLQLLFAVHPRTRQLLNGMGFSASASRLKLVDPLGYVEFLALQQRASMVITDSGGIQEETTYLGIPCLTVRENTERPATVTLGTNILVGRDMDRLRLEAAQIIKGKGKAGGIPPLWDGKASDRIAGIITSMMSALSSKTKRSMRLSP